MSKFVQLGDDQQDLGVGPTTNAQFRDDSHESMSLASEDLELGRIDGASGSGGSKNAIKNYIRDKKAKIAQFDVKAFAESKRDEIQSFSLEEFMTGKRQVLIRACLGELVVTTLFLFTVCSVALNLDRTGHAESESLVVSALSTGFCAVAYIYSFADVSGAHFNPAVTFATIVTKKTSVAKGCLYILMQIIASLIAMLMLVIAYEPKPNMSVPAELIVRPNPDLNLARALCMEVFLSFILVYVIFAVAFDTVDNSATQVKIVDDKGNDTKSQSHRKNLTIYTTSGSSKAGFAPLSIGLTLGFLCFVGGSVSGGAFNPARAFGPALCSWIWDYQWLYWIGDLLGASLAGLLHQNVFASSKIQQAAAAASSNPVSSAAI